MTASRSYSFLWFLLINFGYAGSLLLLHGLSLVVASEAYPLVAVCRLLIAMASLVVEHRLWSKWVSVVVANRLSCSSACEIFLDQGSNLCPLHWQVDS